MVAVDMAQLPGGPTCFHSHNIQHVHKEYVCGCKIVEDDHHLKDSDYYRLPLLLQCEEHGGGTKLWYPYLLPKEQEQDEELYQLQGLS